MLSAEKALESAALDTLSAEDQAFAKSLRSDAAAVRAALAEFESEEGYCLVTSGGRGALRSLYRHDPSTPFVHSIQMSGEVDSETKAVLSIAREWDLVSSWNTFLLDTLCLSVDNLLSVTVYAALWTPPPLSHRDFAVHVRGVDLFDSHGCVLLMFSSADPDQDSLPEKSKSRVRMHWKSAAIKLTPTSGGATIGTLVAHVDPSLPGGMQPPAWLVEWAMRVCVPACLWRRLLYPALTLTQAVPVHIQGGLPSRPKRRAPWLRVCATNDRE